MGSGGSGGGGNQFSGPPTKSKSGLTMAQTEAINAAEKNRAEVDKPDLGGKGGFYEKKPKKKKPKPEPAPDTGTESPTTELNKAAKKNLSQSGGPSAERRVFIK